MLKSDAIILANSLRHSTSKGARLSAQVENDRVVFLGGKHGPHSLDVGVSTAARVEAHWEGYCEAQEPAPAPTCPIHGVVHG